MIMTEEQLRIDIGRITKEIKTLSTLNPGGVIGGHKTIFDIQNHLRDLRCLYHTELINREMVNEAIDNEEI